MLCAAAIAGAVFTSCSESEEIRNNELPTAEESAAILGAGFKLDNFVRRDDGSFLVEGDIETTVAELRTMGTGTRVLEQYSTNNLVSTGGSRNITMYAPEGGKNGYSAGMIAGLDLAISRYNAQNLEITFSRVSSSSGADITMTRLSKGEERRGILGSAGFPTSSGDPYNNIKMSGILESTYGLSTGGIATIIGHEMGHCIGMRHTDYFNRSISCGGAASNEGASTVGANHIPGTPTGASASAKSWMLACTDGGDRPFNNDDRTALDYLY